MFFECPGLQTVVSAEFLHLIVRECSMQNAYYRQRYDVSSLLKLSSSRNSYPSSLVEGWDGFR